MTQINHGPASALSEHRHLLLAEQPLAARLEAALSSAGINVSCEERQVRHNEHAKGAGDAVRQWHQFSVSEVTPKLVSELASRIAELGSDVVFGELLLPKREICVSRQQSGGGVIVRHITYHQPQTDSVAERYDVVVRTR